MSNSLQSLMAIYEVKPILQNKRHNKRNRRVRSIIQTNSAHNPTYHSHKNLKKPRPSNYSVKPYRRYETNHRSLQQAAQNILNRSFDEDIEKLENLTVRNISARKDWLNVQERIVAIQIHSQLKTINETDESHGDYYPENMFTNPVDVLVQKYESHKKNQSYAHFPY